MSIRLTGFGYLVLVLTILALLLSANFINNLLFMVACLWLSVLVTSAVMTVFQFRQVRMTGWRFDELYARSHNQLHLMVVQENSALPLSLCGSTELLWIHEPEQCGRYSLTPPVLQSHDPLGCWLVSRPSPVIESALVFPAPVLHHNRPSASVNRNNELQNGDEIRQIRGYQQGDSFRSVDWKASARSGQWQVREMSGDPIQTATWLRWDSLSDLTPTQRQETLCAWVLDLFERNESWGLVLPDHQLSIQSGSQHKRTSLELLTEVVL